MSATQELLGPVVTPRFVATTVDTFCSAYCRARLHSTLIRAATSPWHEVLGSHPDADWLVSEDHLSGFGVDPADGTLLGVFSLARGRGNALLEAAVWRGAARLWCFDGYLTGLYARHGFVEVSRVPNWTPGEPDVVHMVHAQTLAESAVVAS